MMVSPDRGLSAFDYYESLKATANLVIYVMGFIWICCFGLFAVTYPSFKVIQIIDRLGSIPDQSEEEDHLLDQEKRSKSKRTLKLIVLLLKPKTSEERDSSNTENRKKETENCKTALLIREISASGTVVNCLKDIVQLKKPHVVFFNKKNNDSLPFEDITKLEFFSQENDASLFLMATHNKKRPHNLIMGRMFDHRFTKTTSFFVAKLAAGIKPCLIFTGEAFEQQEN
uniref:Ribosome production factor 2 homolog n=1 Tax=Strigamia maritima TaxID=126957 RepID=T1IVI2_STRMM